MMMHDAGPILNPDLLRRVRTWTKRFGLAAGRGIGLISQEPLSSK
jgi:hypothetical protein